MSGRACQTVRADSSNRVAQTAHTRLSPSLLQSLEVLSMPVARLDIYARTLAECNPLLDYDYDRAALIFDQIPSEEDEDSDEEEFELVSAPVDRTPSCSREEGFDFSRLRDDCLETETLQSHLRMQIQSDAHSALDAQIIDLLLEAIDDNGYFAGSLHAISAQCGCTLEEAETQLMTVQELSPRGVGARDLSECLLLQLNETDPNFDVIAAILRESLTDFAENRTTQLMREYHLSLDCLSAIRTTIAGLNPRPGAGFSQHSETVYVIPDISIMCEGSGLSVRVTGELSESLVLSEDYRHLMEGANLDDEAREWLESKKNEATAVLASMDQRKKTLYKFGLYLAEAQYPFFRSGEACMRPLTMQQAADSLGVHVSTISRTVQDKYALTPWGVVSLKSFFTSAIAGSEDRGSAMLSSLTVKDRIRAIIAEEDVHHPLCDGDITEQLNDEGIAIKRRTVAKYREALGICKRSQRRR